MNTLSMSHQGLSIAQIAQINVKHLMNRLQVLNFILVFKKEKKTLNLAINLALNQLQQMKGEKKC